MLHPRARRTSRRRELVKALAETIVKNPQLKDAFDEVSDPLFFLIEIRTTVGKEVRKALYSMAVLPKQ
jgi:hypothetical protein